MAMQELTTEVRGNRARAMLQLAAKQAPRGRDWPTTGAAHLGMPAPDHLTVRGAPCSVDITACTHRDHIEIVLVAHDKIIASLTWRGITTGWVLHVAALPERNEQAFLRYLGQLRDAIERGVEYGVA